MRPPLADRHEPAAPPIADPQRSAHVPPSQPPAPLRHRWRVARRARRCSLAACGGSSPSNDVRCTPRNSRPKRSSRTSPGACANTASTPKPRLAPGGGHGLKVSARHRADPQQMEAAQKACERYQPEPQKLNLSPQQKVEREEAVAEVRQVHARTRDQSRSLDRRRRRRDPDPRHAGAGGAPNPESPAFQQRRAPARGCCPPRVSGPPGARTGSRARAAPARRQLRDRRLSRGSPRRVEGPSGAAPAADDAARRLPRSLDGRRGRSATACPRASARRGAAPALAAPAALLAGRRGAVAGDRAARLRLARRMPSAATGVPPGETTPPSRAAR